MIVIEANLTTTCRVQQRVVDLLIKFALIPPSAVETNWEKFVDMKKDSKSKQVRVPGWHKHWFPYKVTINSQDRSRGCGLTQTENYTCGPLTVVKFVDSLYRLNIHHNVRFTGPRAKQRIEDDNWNVLGESIPFGKFPFDKHKNDQAWKQMGPDGKTVLVTDKHCIDYITQKLLKTSLDGEWMSELGAEGHQTSLFKIPADSVYGTEENNHIENLTEEFRKLLSAPLKKVAKEKAAQQKKRTTKR